MELMEVLKSRRSIRKFQDKPVETAVLRELLEAACTAPSGINLQPWYFVAVQSPEGREKYLSFMQETAAKFRPTLEARFSRHPEVIEETGTFLTTLGGAPVVILAFLLKAEYTEGKDGRSAVSSVSAAIENLLLAAWNKGLGTCWMTAPIEAGLSDRIRAEFAPDKGEFLASIVLGYPDIAPNMPPRREGRYTIV